VEVGEDADCGAVVFAVFEGGGDVAYVFAFVEMAEAFAKLVIRG
jgi:hypothetical protein